MNALLKLAEEVRASSLSAPAVTVAEMRGPAPGTRMKDGTLYAGICPRTGRAMFTTPDDAGVTNVFSAMSLSMQFKSAATAVKKLNDEQKFGHDDWQLPDNDQILILARGAKKIGGFELRENYWSGTPPSGSLAWVAHLRPIIGVTNSATDAYARVRCIRFGDAPPLAETEHAKTQKAVTVLRPLRLVK